MVTSAFQCGHSVNLQQAPGQGTCKLLPLSPERNQEKQSHELSLYKFSSPAGGPERWSSTDGPTVHCQAFQWGSGIKSSKNGNQGLEIQQGALEVELCSLSDSARTGMCRAQGSHEECHLHDPCLRKPGARCCLMLLSQRLSGSEGIPASPCLQVGKQKLRGEGACIAVHS